MTFNLHIFGDKLSRYRNQFLYSITDVAYATGISHAALAELETGNRRPTGDEVLILADFFKCDYKFFLSNEKLAPFEQTETLFRKFGSEFSQSDRWSVQECLFLADCEAYLERSLNKQPVVSFEFIKTGDIFKNHGKLAAKSLRSHLNYSEKEVSMHIYRDMRNIGIRVFRRKLENSSISGLFIKHPAAGKCVFINYSEDIYRQRFTAAHETAHTILDEEKDVLVSFTKWGQKDLVEIRANAFASAYLMPSDFIKKIPECYHWTPAKAIEWANKLKVSVQALAIALLENKFVNKTDYDAIKNVRIPKELKEDPEMPASLSVNSKKRKQELLERGLSDHFVALCFEAYRENIVSAARLIEMLLLESDYQLIELAELYGEKIRYGS